MNNRLRSYVFYLSLGLNIALLGGFLYTGNAGTPTREKEPLKPQRVEEESESDEWRAFRGRMTELESNTRSLRQKIARKQRKLLKRIRNHQSDGDTRAIQTTHDSIHELQRKLQDRTLTILLEQNQKLSGRARRRVFGRLLKQHQRRYRDLYSEDGNEPGDDHDDEEDENDSDD